MPANSDRRLPRSEASATHLPGQSYKATEKLKAFLKGLRDKPDATSPPICCDKNIFGRRAWWLSYCVENSLDVTTLEETLKWHGRIVRELTRRIEIVSRSDFPTHIKTSMMFDLMHKRIEYNRNILNIDRALQREEDVDWQWWS